MQKKLQRIKKIMQNVLCKMNNDECEMFGLLITYFSFFILSKISSETILQY